MTTAQPEDHQPEPITPSSLFAAGDFRSLSDLYDGIALATGGDVLLAPACKRGRPLWRDVTLADLLPTSGYAVDMADAARRCVHVSGFIGCDPQTEVIVHFAESCGDAPFVRQIAGPACDKHIAALMVCRDLDYQPKMEPVLPKSADREADNDNDAASPVDLWARYASPPLPAGLLPSILEDYARAQGELMGADPGGVAAAALAVCAAAIPDTLKIQVKAHDTQWRESARIWVALVGEPSTKKSPIISAVTEPLKAIDRELYRAFSDTKAHYDALPTEVRRLQSPPRHTRLRLEDTTIEAAQEVLKDSPDGLLCMQDELSGWFGSMDKYGSARGAAKDRGFWLQSFNGGSYVVNRVGRGASMIDNLSVSMLGGIQPGPIRKVVAESADDGLIQRLFPIVLSRSEVGRDVPTPAVVGTYAKLVTDLRMMRPAAPGGSGNLAGHLDVPLRFDPDAQAVRAELEARHNRMADFEIVNRKLAAHIGKLDGLFARLCVVWHCVEHAGDGRPPQIVPEDTARRTADFLHQFLFPHAFAFYSDLLGLSDRHDALLATAGHILAHRPPDVSVRTLQRGDRMMRSAVEAQEAVTILEQLEAFGWLIPVPQKRNQTNQHWTVRPSVYAMFADKAAEEERRRASIREMIAAMPRAA